MVNSDLIKILHLSPHSRIFIHPMKLKAYAKINIGLKIVRKREDGFHDLETVFHRIDVTDEIVFEPATTIDCTCDSREIPTDETNLCLRAARLLQKESNAIRGAHIVLTKRIPVGAGLGGGSSDAAATLRGLNKFWGLNLSGPELHSLALRLGSDVPYFLNKKSAIATGRGDILEYFSLDLPYWILLVYPKIHISTAWAYGQLQTASGSGFPLTKSIFLDNLKKPDELVRSIVNDFEAPVFHHHPELKEIKERLLTAGAVFALMSGSGSAIYGFFTDYENVHQLSADLGKRYQTFLTPPHFQPGE